MHSYRLRALFFYFLIRISLRTFAVDKETRKVYMSGRDGKIGALQDVWKNLICTILYGY